ncbi:MAG: tail fiber domain-containing protein [Chitinophagaceae bacterium]|nr:tail fiber domain-containing protein [Chitinophagaceae bacterium]
MKQSFKTLSAFLLALSISAVMFAQAPQKFNYQGIARDLHGSPLAKQAITLKITILPTADATSAEYEEIQTVTTNEFGLYTLQIGNGTAVTGEMKTVSWETGNKYIKVAIDPRGGHDFADAGSSQLLSVPYALYADKAGTTTASSHNTRTGAVNTSAAGTGTVNYLCKFTAPNTIYNSQLFDNGTNIGIGTTSPLGKLHIFTNTGNQEHIRMQNTNPNGFGKFIMYNDVISNYANFTKYGSTYPGGYAGISSQVPFANLFAFGNNNGPSLFSNSGNVGINIVKGGSSNLKFFVDYNTLRLGLGGNATPAAKVHFNTATGADTVKFTNATTGHLVSDGTELRMEGVNTSMVNRENGFIVLGTDNTERMRVSSTGRVGIGTSNPAARLHVADSSVVFTGPSSLPAVASLPPLSGAGTRMMWYADKSAFRVGAVSGNHWDRDSVGKWSVAMGENPTALGHWSLALGLNANSRTDGCISIGANTYSWGLTPAIAIGMNAIAKNDGTVSIGEDNIASGYYSTAIGNGNRTPGWGSIAYGMGNYTTGDGSMAFGVNTKSSGVASTSFSRGTIANGNYSSAHGAYTISNGYGTTAIGIYNDSIVSAQTSFDPTTPLFIIGNGNPLGQNHYRSNALVVRYDGRMGLGTNFPNGQFELSLDEGRKPGTSTWTITSDERLKVMEGNYTKGLQEIMQLSPIRYHYKNAEGRTFSEGVLAKQQVGFSAQAVQQVFPDAVSTDADGYLNLNLHPILVAQVNAIKEQQVQIEAQQNQNMDLKKEVDLLKKQNELLNSRLEKLELMLSK